MVQQVVIELLSLEAITAYYICTALCLLDYWT